MSDCTDIGLLDYIIDAAEDAGIPYDEDGCARAAEDIALDVIDQVDAAIATGDLRSTLGPPAPVRRPQYDGQPQRSWVASPGRELPDPLAPDPIIPEEGA